MFEKFEKFSILSFLRSNPHTRWCPYPACEGAFIGTEESSGKVFCGTCAQPFCFACSGQWHENMTCAENKINTSEDDKK